MKNVSTITKIDNIREDLVSINKDLNKRILYDLKDSWKGTDATSFAYKIEDLSNDIKKIIIKLDELKKYNNLKNKI